MRKINRRPAMPKVRKGTDEAKGAEALVKLKRAVGYTIEPFLNDPEAFPDGWSRQRGETVMKTVVAASWELALLIEIWKMDRKEQV